MTSTEQSSETTTSAAAQARAARVATWRGGRLFYRCTHVFIRVVLYRYFRVRRRGAEHLATPGPLILAPVHRSNLDAPLVAGMAAWPFVVAWALTVGADQNDQPLRRSRAEPTNPAMN